MYDGLQIKAMWRGIAAYPPGATYGPRYLPEYEFIWMIEGDAVYEAENQRILAPEGTFLLCRPGVTDYFVWDKKRRTRHGYCHFEISNLPDSFPPESEWPYIAEFPREPVLEAVFRFMLGLDEEDTLAADSALELLLIAFITGPVPSERKDQDVPDSVARVLRYIAKRLDEESDAHITLTDMADAACCTKEHLCRIFKRTTGVSPLESVRAARLESAATLLSRSNYSVSEVSSLFGFSNPSHFAKCFTSAYGMSPTEFRRNSHSGASLRAPVLVS